MCCSFGGAYCGCVLWHECMLSVRVCVFCPPTVDWLEIMPLARTHCVCLVTSLWLSPMFLFSNKATFAQSCLPSKHEPRMMKLCALPNCKASFTPWYLLPFPLPLALLSRFFSFGLQQTDSLLQTESFSASQLSLHPALRFHHSFCCHQSKLGCQREREKSWKMS